MSIGWYQGAMDQRASDGSESSGIEGSIDQGASDRWKERWMSR